MAGLCTSPRSELAGSATPIGMGLNMNTGSLHLVLSEAGIDKLIAIASDARREMDQAADRRP